MRTKFLRDIFIIPSHIYFVTTLIVIFVFLVGLCRLWAEEKTGSALSLNEIIELALDFNSQKLTDNNFRSSEDIVFLVKKYYYQVQIQMEQLDTTEEVRGHFQKGKT